jgi:hypothetical protein
MTPVVLVHPGSLVSPHAVYFRRSLFLLTLGAATGILRRQISALLLHRALLLEYCPSPLRQQCLAAAVSVVSCAAQRGNTGSSGPANASKACTPGGCLMLHGFGMVLQRAG